MDGTLIFCRDGIIRFRSFYDESEAIPLRYIQTYQEADNDPFFIMDYLKHPVITEAGTTFSDILFALMPWQNFLNRYLLVNLDEYIKAIRKPSEADSHIDWIGVSRVTVITRAVKPQLIEQPEDMQQIFSDIQKSKDLFFTDIKSYAFGYVDNDPTPYALEGHIQAIKNTPVIVSARQYVYSPNFEDETYRLFNQKYSGVKKHDTQGLFLTMELEMQLGHFLEGIFENGIYYNEQEQTEEDYRYQIISDALKMAEKPEDEHQLASEDQNKSNDETQDEPKHGASKSVFTKDPLDLEHLTPEQEEIMQNFAIEETLNNMFEHIAFEQDEWEALRASCNSNSEWPIRIGLIEQAIEPDFRLMDMIIPNPNKSDK